MAADHEDLADEPPVSINPYRALDLGRDATTDQIKTAYRKAALKTHPDKVAASDKEIAHRKFQEIAFAYAILSDPRRRSRYDITGRTNESLSIEDDDFNWSDFFRNQFAEVVTEASIAKLKKEYQGSEEEKLAVIDAYITFEGRLDGVFDVVMLSNALDDEDRFRKIIDNEIKEKRIEGYDAYTKETKNSRKHRIKVAEKEAEEAQELARELGIDALLDCKADNKDNDERGPTGHRKKSKTKASANDSSSLAALIQQRQKSRADNFLANLEAKYAPKTKGKRAAEEEEGEAEEIEPSEADFQAAKKRILDNKEKRTSARPIASSRKKRSKKS